MKRIIYGVSSALMVGMALVCLWRTLYWHWESANPLSAEETHAGYHSHVWLVRLCIFAVVASMLSALLFLSMRRRKHSDANAA